MIPINKRKIGVCILLSFVTFGIYTIYWQYLLVKNTRAIQKDESNCTGEMLCILFVPFYSLFWWFTRGKIVKDRFTEHGYSAIGNEIAYLLLSIFGLVIVSMAIMQNDFNALKSESSQSIHEDSSIWIGIFMVFSVVLGLVLGVGLFILLPTFIYGGAAKLLPFLNHENPAVHSLIKSIFEGVLKIVLIVGYMALMILMKDIRRTFQFHGAEHKTIFCYEAGLELTVENIRKQKRFHPRCGTSFLILMILVSIFISFFIDPLFLLAFGFVPTTIFRVLIKLLLMPLIVGIGYELIKLAGKYDNLFTRILSAPGVWLQHITVLEPDDSMIECAIAAMNEVIPENGSDNW